MKAGKYPEISHDIVSRIESHYQKKLVVSKYSAMLRQWSRDHGDGYPLTTRFMTADHARELVREAQTKTAKEALGSFAIRDDKDHAMGNILPPFLKHLETYPRYKNKNWVLSYHDANFEKIDILSNFFSEHVRVECSVGKHEPPVVFFQKNMDRVISKAIDYAVETKTNLNAKALSEALFRCGMRNCTTFKVSLGVIIFEQVFYSKRVFDPFAGWTCRALAAQLSDCVEYYKGVDVNPCLTDCYTRVQNFFAQEENSKKRKLHFETTAIEDVDYEKEIAQQDIDTVFSSPPFFDFEKYESGDGGRQQSYAKFPEKNAWLREWLLPVSLAMVRCLKPGAFFSYYLGGNEREIIDSLILCFQQAGVTNFLGVIPIVVENEPVKKRPLFLFVWQRK